MFASEARTPLARTKSRPSGGETPGPPREHAHKGDQASDLAKLPRAGAVLGKYRLEELLGLGGFAAVYRATHMLLSMPVALKVLRPSVLRKRPLLGELLCTEGRFAAMINHPNIVRVHDVVQEKSLTYLVMEYVDGMTLGKTIALHGALEPTKVLRIAREVAEGLKAGVTRGLMHRDVKPANILLSVSGEAKLLDFGFAIATSTSPTALGTTSSPAPTTTPGATPSKSPTESYFGRNCIVGTRGYMAPEQESAPNTVDFRADMYSLGITIHEAACGRLPTNTATRTDSSSRRPRSTSGVQIPPPLATLIGWLTAPRPEDRPPSYDALLARIEETTHRL